MKLTYKIIKSQSIHDFLLSENYSKKLISALKYEGGKIILNGINMQVEAIITENDCLEVIFPKEEPVDTYPESNKPISIVYEDEYIIIISKPEHLETIPSKLNNDDTLANRLKYYYRINNIFANIHIITRLDKETSGLVMVAKNRYIHHLFSNIVTIDKKYLALVHNHLSSDQIIEANIKRDNPQSIKRIVSLDGDYAKTGVKVIKYIENLTLVQCTLYTGRTHQIRVHLNHIGTPILGDKLYNEDGFERLYLHCYYLNFTHPITKLPITINDYPKFNLNIIR